MNKLSILIALFAIFTVSCKSPSYRISHMSGIRVEIDSRFDKYPNKEMQALVDKYKVRLDNEMQEVIGSSAHLMEYGIPESLLTNFTSDVMKAYGDECLPEGCDLSIMNVHGHRASMPLGKITVGNLYEIYSFDNVVVFLELKGSDLRKIFDTYAKMGGAGTSANVRLTVQNKKVSKITIDNRPIDDDRVYNISTLDYLAEGNNGMSAFRSAIKTINTGVTLRDVMIDYVREQTRQGKEIRSKLDGRITVVE